MGMALAKFQGDPGQHSSPQPFFDKLSGLWEQVLVCFFGRLT